MGAPLPDPGRVCEAIMRVGICGYPGSGKTTVFKALAPGARPGGRGLSLGSIKVPDARVERLAAIFDPRKTVFAEIVFADVSGAAGRGAGAFPPQVLEHMRGMDVLVNVVRAFDNPAAASTTSSCCSTSPCWSAAPSAGARRTARGWTSR
jgi:ribosome-binding ATPase YchF (GTP1/OBG family)